MRPVIFTAGLGDVIRSCYLTRSLQHLEEATQPVPVVVASHNPFSIELFRFHRNSAQFVLYDLGHKYQQLLGTGLGAAEINRGLCEFAGVDYPGLVREPADPGYHPVFDAPDNVASAGHIVFQPFAGNNGYRGFSVELLERTVSVLRELPCAVFLVTRSYLRGGGPRALHGEEDARRWEGGNLVVLDSLSTPATLNLVKSARALVGSFSSLVQAAWFEDKPVATFYPADCRDACGYPPSPYAFGMHRPDCLGRSFSAADMAELRSFLERWF